MHVSRYSNYISGLNGLRAIAVTSVLIYHLGIDSLPGGFLGVDLFFVISGFLITTLLLEEVDKNGHISLRKFYLRRARRLLPALYLMLLGVFILSATVAQDIANQVVRDFLAVIGYGANWWFIFQSQSYFELVGRGNVLAHMWSLAVEEQFYLIWPTLFIGLIIIARRLSMSLRLVVGATSFLGLLLSTWNMWRIADFYSMPEAIDPTRIYFGTDTHAMSVLMGVLLAALWNPNQTRLVSKKSLLGINLLSLFSVIVCGFVMWNVTEYDASLYRGGFTLYAILFAVLVTISSIANTMLSKFCELKPLVWLGERSYGIYLWHYPIFLVTRPGLDFDSENAWVHAARIAVVLIIADVSYRFVETPIRGGAIGRWWANVKSLQREMGWFRSLIPTSNMARFFVLPVIVSSIMLTSAVHNAASANIGDQILQEAANNANVVVPEGDLSELFPVEATPEPTPSETSGEQKTPFGSVRGRDISWYGDSVSLWASAQIKSKFRGATIDAEKNRSPLTIMNRALADLKAKKLRRVVVLHLGTCGPMQESSLRSTLKALRKQDRVVVINTTARFKFVPANNRLLKRVHKDYPNVVLADWYKFSKGHKDWFVDGLHLSDKGKPIFVKFISQVMFS